MEHSKSVSSAIAKLKIAYPYYFKELKTEEFAGLISMYQEFLSGYNESTISNAIKFIISKNKYMPSINELIAECEKCKTYRGNVILSKMKTDGYFKRGSVGELDEIHASRNYEKALMWLEKNIIPTWLLNDMKEYGYVEDKILLTNSNSYLIGMQE